MSHDAIPLPLIERIERALVLLACFIEMDGDVHVPMYEKFEAELEQLCRKEGTKDRARRRLLSNSLPGRRQVLESRDLCSQRSPNLWPGRTLLKASSTDSRESSSDRDQ